MGAKPAILLSLSVCLGIADAGATDLTSSEGVGTSELLVSACQAPGPHQTPHRQLAVYDFVNGRVQLAATMNAMDSPGVGFLDAKGKHLQVRKTTTQPSAGHDRIQLSTADSEAPSRVFDASKVRSWWPMSLSPDGKRMAVYESGRGLILGDSQHAHVIPSKWVVEGPLVWNSSSSQVAFYYALSDVDADLHVKRHGVAVADVKGSVRTLVNAESALPTPGSWTKELGPRWDRTGKYIYYTAGLPPEDPRRRDFPHGPFTPPSVACKANLATGESQVIALGELAGVWPDGRTVLLYPAPTAADSGLPGMRARTVDTQTGETSDLPRDIRYPRLSPSGRLVSCITPERAIRCYRTDPWQPVGRPVPAPGGMGTEEWARDFRWITVEDEAAFRRQFEADRE